MNNQLHPLYVLHQTYGNSLDDDETKIYTPYNSIKIPLRRHQYSVIDTMNDYENKMLNGKSIDNSIMYSKYGILGDSVGVGKTFMILGHIASIKHNRTMLEFPTFNHSSTKTLYLSLIHI